MNSKTTNLFKQGWLIILLCAFCLSCSQKKNYEYPFQNPELSFEERAENIVSLLTVEEKVQQMVNNAPAIERLGIPAYNWWNETLHGVARSPYAVTSYPQPAVSEVGFRRQNSTKNDCNGRQVKQVKSILINR